MEGLYDLLYGRVNDLYQGDAHQEVLKPFQEPGAQNIRGDDSHQKDDYQLGNNSQPENFSSDYPVDQWAEEAVEESEEPITG